MPSSIDPAVVCPQSLIALGRPALGQACPFNPTGSPARVGPAGQGRRLASGGSVSIRVEAAAPTLAEPSSESAPSESAGGLGRAFPRSTAPGIPARCCRLGCGARGLRLARCCRVSSCGPAQTQATRIFGAPAPAPPHRTLDPARPRAAPGPRRARAQTRAQPCGVATPIRPGPGLGGLEPGLGIRLGHSLPVAGSLACAAGRVCRAESRSEPGAQSHRWTQPGRVTFAGGVCRWRWSGIARARSRSRGRTATSGGTGGGPGPGPDGHRVVMTRTTRTRGAGPV